jgi:hypothetical protein
VPGKSRRRRGSERRLEDALEALSTGLTDSGVPWSVIGGIAVIAHGVRRLTTDIDAVVKGGSVSVAETLRILAQCGFEPRIEDAEQFAMSNLVLLLHHRPTGVDIDLSFGWTEFENRAIGASVVMPFGRVRVPMVGPADLVAFKAIAGRARDIDDAAALLLLHPEIDVDAVRRQVQELAGLAEAPELIGGLDEALRRAGVSDRTERAAGARKRRRSPKRSPRA